VCEERCLKPSGDHQRCVCDCESKKDDNPSCTTSRDNTKTKIRNSTENGSLEHIAAHRHMKS
jgi:hypothetical protein